MLKRKCCGGCAELGNCTDWCDCLPDDIHLRVDLYQRWEIWDNGVLKDYADLDLSVRNVEMTKYADKGECFLYSTGNGGSWFYNYDYSNKVYPQYSFYIQPNCLGCLDLQQCYTRNMSGSGDIAPSEVIIDCYDPCNVPLGYGNVYPTNRILLDFVAPLTVTDTNYNECLAINGSAPPPFDITEAQYIQLFGKWECLDTNTFASRTLRWTNIYDNQTPHQDSYICTNINTCSGGCKGAYSCLCKDPECSPPYLPQYDWWSSYTINSCTEELCVDTHSCWNGYYGNQPAVFECTCNAPSKSGVIKREYKHWMTSSVTITIP